MASGSGLTSSAPSTCAPHRSTTARRSWARCSPRGLWALAPVGRVPRPLRRLSRSASMSRPSARTLPMPWPAAPTSCWRRPRATSSSQRSAEMGPSAGRRIRKTSRTGTPWRSLFVPAHAAAARSLWSASVTWRLTRARRISCRAPPCRRASGTCRRVSISPAAWWTAAILASAARASGTRARQPRTPRRRRASSPGRRRRSPCVQLALPRRPSQASGRAGG
mmetsp:Transcript_35395/g.80415  ORF Transcript_35395/g.80415 Transcript_35395/m.80415 type:complete len:222 (+) Transcript_35395:1029-1694(+)